MNQGPELSLVVCTYRRPGPLRRLLEGVADQTRIPDEVLVIDASPDRETADVVERVRQTWHGPRLEYHAAPPEQRGLTRQRNSGIDRSRGGIVAFLDDDTVPEPHYFAEVLSCFDRHPEAVGVGGYITNEVRWKPPGSPGGSALKEFCLSGWSRREDYRWRLRRLLGLTPSTPPGWLPPAGHGRSVGFLPPDGRDYPVEFVMGGASAWRRGIFDRHRFSRYFEGYGLYEDLEFCLRAGADGPLYLCTAAGLAHHHSPTGRPASFRYGTMVVRNGWYVWRRRWPEPRTRDRARWWATTALLAAVRMADAIRGPGRRNAMAEAWGRAWGMVTLPRLDLMDPMSGPRPRIDRPEELASCPPL